MKGWSSMAERRMFAKTIIDSDAFIDMPVTARLLYYDLGMRADDDGFVNSPKKIMRMVGASQDDLAILISKKFIIPFDSGVVVIKHWRIHNYIRQDRKHNTKYEKEMSLITVKDNGAYTLTDTCQSDVSQLSGSRSTEVRLGKVRKGKDKEKIPPTLEEVTEYCKQRQNQIDPQRFIDFYDANGWVQGKNKPIKSWKACIRTWEASDVKCYGRRTPLKMDVPDYIQQQIDGTLPEEQAATAEQIEAIKKLQEKM